MVTNTSIRYFLSAICLLIPFYASAFEWPQQPKLDARSWALIDARSGQTLSQNDADLELPPASLTKMMTLYLIFEDLKLGRLSLDETINISNKAWKIGGSTMFLEPRMKPHAKELMHGISTLSGNDACIAMAEHLAGSEESFATRMNEKAKILGMKHSHFVNATGFPAENHYSSANDMALLGAALWRDFPEEFKLFSEKNYTFDGRTQWNRNRMLWSMPESDGIKTGHTEEAGYCLVTSAEQQNTRLISAVFGTQSDKARQQQSRILLKFGFRNFVTLRPAERDVRRQVEVFEGTREHVWLKPENPVWVSVPKGYQKQLAFRLSYDSPIKAPIAKGASIGSIAAIIKEKDGSVGETLATTPMLAVREVEQASWFGRQWDGARLWWRDNEDDAGDE
ncbi:MAG: D-alanyl-D-alanine carboxypeptidase family protein [Mariprofundaceae bacterium]